MENRLERAIRFVCGDYVCMFAHPAERAGTPCCNQTICSTGAAHPCDLRDLCVRPTHKVRISYSAACGLGTPPDSNLFHVALFCAPSVQPVCFRPTERDVFETEALRSEACAPEGPHDLLTRRPRAVNKLCTDTFVSQRLSFSRHLFSHTTR